MKHFSKLFMLLVFVGYLTGCTKDEDNPKPTSPTTSTDARSYLVGEWLCNEVSEVFNETTYTIGIQLHTTVSNRVVASNFYNYGFENSNAQFEINGNQITIFQQNLSGIDVVGNGTIVNSKTINLSYVVNDGSGDDHVTAVYTKVN
mgnify:FL=1